MEDKIKEELNYLHGKDLYSLFMESHKDVISFNDEYKVYLKDICNILKTSNIIEVYNTLKEKYEISSDRLYVERVFSILYIVYTLTGKFKNEISILLDNEKLLERVYIRIVLLKEGWDKGAIEKFLSKHYNLEWSDKYDIYYIYLKNMLCIQEKNNIRGRPKIPERVRDIIEVYIKDKNVDKMRVIYEVYKDLKNLFTEEEINYLSSVVNEGRNELKEKLEILKKYT
jgi:hypothetical protein